MPAILPDEEAVSAWLDPNLHGFEALRVLRPIPKETVSWQCLGTIQGVHTVKYKAQLFIN